MWNQKRVQMNLSMKHKSNKDLLYSRVNSTQNSIMEKIFLKKNGDLSIYLSIYHLSITDSLCCTPSIEHSIVNQVYSNKNWKIKDLKQYGDTGEEMGDSLQNVPRSPRPPAWFPWLQALETKHFYNMELLKSIIPITFKQHLNSFPIFHVTFLFVIFSFPYLYFPPYFVSKLWTQYLWTLLCL